MIARGKSTTYGANPLSIVRGTCQILPRSSCWVSDLGVWASSVPVRHMSAAVSSPSWPSAPYSEDSAHTTAHLAVVEMVSADVSRSPVCAWRLVPPVQQQVSARRHGKLPRRPATERPASSAFREPPLRFQPVSSAPMGCKSSPGCSGAAAMAAADVLLPLDESSRNVGRSSRHQVARRRHASSAHPGQHGPRHGLQPSGAAV